MTQVVVIQHGRLHSSGMSGTAAAATCHQGAGAIRTHQSMWRPPAHRVGIRADAAWNTKPHLKITLCRMILRWGMVARAGIEPATFHFSGGRSYRLSYLAGSTGRYHSRGPGPFSDPDGT